MNAKKQCLISYAKNGREAYEKALDRNKFEAQKHFDGDFIYLKDELPKGCPPHQVVPYAFKPYLFKQAYDLGYRQILWLDSTIVMVRNPESIFHYASKKGVVAFHNLGHNLPEWISDKAIKNTGIDIWQEPTQIMACVVGFDLNHTEGKEVFDEWLALSQDGESFQNNPGSWPTFKAHRHDQACLSAILWKREIKLLPYGNLVYTEHEKGYEGRTIYFINKPI